MHLEPVDTLFQDARPSRLPVAGSVFLLGVVLVINGLNQELLVLVPLMLTGITSLICATGLKERFWLWLGSQSFIALLTVLMGYWTQDFHRAILLSLHLNIGLCWGLWFGSQASWPELKRFLRNLHCPELLVEFADQMINSGLAAFHSLEQIYATLTLRGGFGGDTKNKVSNLGLLLASASSQAYDQAVCAEDNRTLRAYPDDLERIEVLPIQPKTELRFENVSVSLNPHTTAPQALTNFSLTLEASEWIAVLGPNGSGKSTLLKTAAGLYQPTQGVVTRFDTEMKGSVLLKRVDPRIALVGQEPSEQLLGSTPLEDMIWGLKQRAVSEQEACERSYHLLEALGIAHLAHRSIQQLSFGEQKRVAFASALVVEPELLLCDEPTSGLDPVAASQLIRVLETVTHHRKIAVIWVTHEWQQLPTQIQRTVLLRNGQKIFDGRRTEGLKPASLAQAGLLPEE
ncbi:energy-coupling factor ABC transporter ATP-binding protein [Vampirovibrio sp.]|uniref:energy-coupling factor ABC transporter ATP-binding protein n=1 Tax=Vampirovibrio sp. TaxID=2717857 RepID=UPI003593091E